MKKYIFVVIFSILLIAWIAFIWYNSMQTAEQSVIVSSGVTDRLNVVINEIADAVHKEPVTTAPVTPSPVNTEPEDTETATTAPATTEPATTAPVTTEPVLKDKVVRKSAHFLEYMLLGILAAVDIVAIADAISRRRTPFVALFMLLSVGLAFAVAAIDEFVIQAATEGRGPSWQDIKIDCGGAAAGTLICIVVFLVTYCFAQIRKNKATSQI